MALTKKKENGNRLLHPSTLGWKPNPPMLEPLSKTVFADKRPDLGVQGIIPPEFSHLDGPSTVLIQLEHVRCKCVHKYHSLGPSIKHGSISWVIRRSLIIRLTWLSLVTGPACLCPLLFFSPLPTSSFHTVNKANKTVLNTTLIWPLISLLFSHSVKFIPHYLYLSNALQTLHSAHRLKCPPLIISNNSNSEWRILPQQKR